MRFRLALLITALVPAPVAANYCAAPQSRVNATISGIVNTYYPVTADIVTGDQIQVGPAFGANADLRVGDIVLLWVNQTMQYVAPSNQNARNPSDFGDGVTGSGWTNLNHSGKFQWLRVAGSGGVTKATGTVVKAAGDAGTTVLTVTNGAGQGPFGTLQLTGQTTLRSAQLIRVPQYGNVTISGTVTAEPYRNTVNSGSTGPRSIGGIVALDVSGKVTFSGGGNINVSGLGYRGAAGQRADGTSVPTYPLTQTSRWYANGGTQRPTGGPKGEGGAGTPHRVYFQGAESANLDYTGTGSVGAEGYGNTTNPAGYGRGAPGNAGGGATDQCPFDFNASSTAGTMCRFGTITYAYSRLNTGGGGGGGYGSGGQGSDQDYDGNNPANSPSGGGLGGVGLGISLTAANKFSDPPVPAGHHQYAMMGGGGGAGSTNAAGTEDLQSSGATGGGVVLIRAGSFAGSGSISADGQDAQDVTAVDPVNAAGTNAGQGNGAGGGGGGGWILLSAREASSPSLTYSAKGGKGGNGNKCMGSGGGGGGGYVATSTTLPAPSGTSVTGGAAGTTSCNLATDLPDATNLNASYDAVAPSGQTAGAAGATGQFPATGLSVPSTLTGVFSPASSSSSIGTGPQCVPLLYKEFSIDGGANWLPSVNASINQNFKMRIRLQNTNEDNFNSGNTQPQVFDDIAFVDTYGAGIVNATPPNVQQSGCNAVSLTATAGGSTLTATSSGAVSGQSTCTITVDLKVTAPGTSTNTIGAEAVSVSQLKQVVGDANKLVLKNFEPVSASVVVPAGVSASKTSAVVSDPINNTTNPKRIPGASVDYTIAITNSSGSTLDNNTMIMSDTLPTTTRMFVGNLNAGAPFQFTAGTSTLTCAFTSLGDANDCIDFSNDGGATWTYTPTPAGDGTDAAVRAIRFRTSGSMPTGTDMSVRYRVVVK